MARIFISYSRKDLAITEELERLLTNVYPNVDYDKNSLKGGDHWWDEIQNLIKLCDHFIFLISETSIISEWCIKELNEALSQKKHIIPIDIQESIELPAYLSFLNNLQKITMTNEITAQSISYLFGSIGSKIRVGYSEGHRASDLKLLNKLWKWINSTNLQNLEYQINSHWVEQDYIQILHRYLRYREHNPESRFIAPDLENHFKEIDETMIIF